MQLYFVRHALAQPHDLGIPDYDRALLPKGIDRTETTAQALKPLGVAPVILYSSPLVRARQTAEILAKVLGVPVQVRDELSPGFDAVAVETLIRHTGKDGDVMFVGHEPDFSDTIHSLTGANVIMKKGGVVRIKVTAFQPVRGVLEWLIPPKIFDHEDEE